MICEEPHTLNLFDTAGQTDFDKLRPLSYPKTDVFIVCFSVISPTTFQNVKETWVPEIQHFCPETPFILVGTQTDLRDDVEVVEALAAGQQKAVTSSEGARLGREVRAVKYLECSALTQKGLKTVFDEVSSDLWLSHLSPLLISRQSWLYYRRPAGPVITIPSLVVKFYNNLEKSQNKGRLLP